MNFVSVEFAIFFLFILPLNHLLRPRTKGYGYFLLAASYFFYGAFSLGFLAILIFFSLCTCYLTWLQSLEKEKKDRLVYLVINLALGLGGLVFFKYYEFLFGAADHMFVAAGVENPLPILEIALPVGISFFTFQGLSYAIDVYRDPEKNIAGPLDGLVFIAFFPTILSGPIMRAKNFVPQLSLKQELSSRSTMRGFFLILSGLFKKIILSSYLSEHIVQAVFEAPESFSSLSVLVGVFAYSIQILCDFSGYTDLAMGFALLLGFDIPQNFNAPYRSLNVREFWSRWHISFSTWLRDYLYIPLGGNRKGTARKHLNLMITMLLGGLWHGANFTFLVWGGLHGLALVLTHAYKDLIIKIRPEAEKKKTAPALDLLKKGAAWLATFSFVTLAWIFFRAESVDQAFRIIGRIAGFTPAGAQAAAFALAVIFFVLIMEFLNRNWAELFASRLEKAPWPLQGAVVGLICTLILMFGPDGVPPFIYFQF